LYLSTNIRKIRRKKKEKVSVHYMKKKKRKRKKKRRRRRRRSKNQPHLQYKISGCHCTTGISLSPTDKNIYGFHFTPSL
jgi:hypothetical protein